METNYISVKYEDNYVSKTFGGKPYNYYTELDLKVGDIVIAPTVSGEKIARVSEINVPEEKIESIKPYLKTINQRVDKDKFLEADRTIQKVA